MLIKSCAVYLYSILKEYDNSFIIILITGKSTAILYASFFMSMASFALSNRVRASIYLFIYTLLGFLLLLLLLSIVTIPSMWVNITLVSRVLKANLHGIAGLIMCKPI